MKAHQKEKVHNLGASLVYWFICCPKKPENNFEMESLKTALSKESNNVLANGAVNYGETGPYKEASAAGFFFNPIPDLENADTATGSIMLTRALVHEALAGMFRGVFYVMIAATLISRGGENREFFVGFANAVTSFLVMTLYTNDYLNVHGNPIVTTAYAAHGEFGFVTTLVYYGGQIAGAFAGVAIAKHFVGIEKIARMVEQIGIGGELTSASSKLNYSIMGAYFLVFAAVTYLVFHMTQNYKGQVGNGWYQPFVFNRDVALTFALSMGTISWALSFIGVYTLDPFLLLALSHYGGKFAAVNSTWIKYAAVMFAGSLAASFVIHRLGWSPMRKRNTDLNTNGFTPDKRPTKNN